VYNYNAESADVSDKDAATARERLRVACAPPVLHDINLNGPTPPLHLPIIHKGEGEGDGVAWDYTTPRHDDDDDIAVYRGRLGRFLEGLDADSAARTADVELDIEIRKERNRQEARDVVQRERAESGFTEPPFHASLVAELAEYIEPPESRIEGLCLVGQNTLCAAKAKAGKTTLSVNLLRSLADGDPFLASLAVNPPAGKVGYLNYEMGRDQFNTWLREEGIQHPERVAVLHLRGHRLPLIAPVAQDFIVKWATECGVEVLIADPWGRMMVGSGSENSNDDVRGVLEILGEIKRRANISDLFVIAHMGHTDFEIGQERARGASELLGWPDVLWNLTKENDTRFISAFGRDIDFAEQALIYDPVARRLTLAVSTENRVHLRTQSRIDEVVDIVTREPGQNTGTVMSQMVTTLSRTERNDAVQAAKRSGRIEGKKVGQPTFLYPVNVPTIPDWEPRFEKDQHD
jgi:hypothetical protein